MTMNNMQLLTNVMRSGGNPQQILMNMIQGQAQNNPILGNVYNMMQNGNSAGIETIAKNLCKERGINPEQMITQIKNQLHI